MNITNINALVVEDNEAEIALLRQKLSKQRDMAFTLHPAKSFTEARQLLANDDHKHKIDVVLLDLNLSDSQGYETVENFLDIQADIPVVVMTDFQGDTELVGRALQCGVQDYVFKSDSSFHDITRSITYAIERHKLQSELKQTVKELQKARQEALDATRAKSEFLAKMSHEIRTPLNGMLGFVEQLSMTFLDTEQRRMLDYATSSGHVLMRVVSDILDMSKIEAGHLEINHEPYNLMVALDTCTAIVDSFIQSKKLNFESNIDDNCPKHILGDSLRLQQILLNLLNNAVKFTEIGFVKLTVQYQEMSKINGFLKIQIEDSGIGIADDQKEKIFNCFDQGNARGENNYSGTGLGLTITREIVDAMGGAIRFKSEVGRGTTFCVDLPVEICEQQNNTFFENQNLKAVRSLKILLAEDLFINQQLTGNMLERLGHTVTIAENGRQAVTAVQENTFDIVLMDIKMPEMDGIEATRVIREELNIAQIDLPIVALTAHVMLKDATKFYEVGMDDYLIKPISLQNLHNKISEVTEGPQLEFIETEIQENKEAPETRNKSDFNRHTYDQMIDFVGEEKAKELTDMFFKDAIDRLEEISSNNLSSEDIKSHYHSMISMSGYLGFEQLSSLCRELVDKEDDVTKDDIVKVQSLFKNIQNIKI